MLGHGATGQFAIGQVSAGATAEIITSDKWFAALSEPVRFKQGLGAAQQQFIALPGPFPFVPFAWFQELSKPAVLTKPGLRPSQQQFFTFNPLPRVSFGWFAPLSEPVRKKPGLPPALQRFFTTDTSVIPLTRLMQWFAALSEPVRFRLGLAPRLQQFLAAPTQLRPNPTITATLSAQETKDVFLAGASTFNRATSAEIGVVDTGFPAAEIGIAAPAVASVSISIRIL